MSSLKKLKKPIPLFDTLKNIKDMSMPDIIIEQLRYKKDFESAIDFLKQYIGSDGTFRAYRRELERLLQWAWFAANKSVFELKRQDIEDYIEFCKNPPKNWIGTKNVARFITKDGERKPNPAWRLFVASVSKSDFKNGLTADTQDYQLSQK